MVSAMLQLSTMTECFWLLGLVNHLRVHFPAMYRLYLVLKEQSEEPDHDDTAIAQGKKPLDPAKASEYLQQLKKASANITQMFAQQGQCAAVSFQM